jgi:hypothetical protein
MPLGAGNIHFLSFSSLPKDTVILKYPLLLQSAGMRSRRRWCPLPFAREMRAGRQFGDEYKQTRTIIRILFAYILLQKILFEV